MTDDDTNPNIEWKKDNIGEQERFSRKIDVQKAVENVEYTNVKVRKKKQTNSIMDILRG